MSTEPRLPYLVDTAWLAGRLDDPDLVVLDCTTRIVPDMATVYRTEPCRGSFEAGHVPGAQFVDVQQDLSDNTHRWKFMLPQTADFAAAMERLGVSDTSHVVLYSTGDPWWATRVWWLLHVFGFERSSVLDGGFQAWQREGRSLETGPGRARPRGTLTARLQPTLVAGREEVLAAIGDGTVCMLNARLPSQFEGKDGNNYGRAGRIPGSVNVPSASLIDPKTNRYRPEPELQERFAAAAPDGKRVIAYCGHGIAASASVFALAMLGHPNVALYDASLSEWAADETLPIAVGAQTGA